MINQPMLDFVKSQLQSGSSREAVTNMLLGQGWSISDITEAFNIVSSPSPIQPSPVQPVQEKPHRKTLPLVISLVVLVLCVAAGGVFAYYKFIPLTPSQIFENSLRATIGQTASFSFEATSTGNVTATKASIYGLPTTADYSFAGSGSLDLHSRTNPSANVDLTLNAGSANSNSTDSVQFSISTIYAANSLYINLRNLNITFGSSAKQSNSANSVNSAALGSMVSSFASRIENQWIRIPAASSTSISSSTESDIKAEVAEINDYIFGMSYVKSISNLGTELVKGINTHHLAVTLRDDGQLSALIKKISFEREPGLASSSSFTSQIDNLSNALSKEINIDVWIGTNDFRVYKIAAGPFSFDDSTSGTVSSSSYETEFSNYGQSMNIEPPADSITLEQLIQKLFGGSAVPISGSAKKSPGL